MLVVPLAAVASLGLWVVLRAQRRTPGGVVTIEQIGEEAGSLLEEVVVTVRRIGGGSWVLPASGEPYRAMLESASQKYGLPWPLLARVAWQESRFRPDVISGKVRSSAGAVGIMQIIPRWHPELGEAGALDPAQAIPYAAKFLRRLFDKFGSWELALAAYNWGEGNVARSTNESAWPKETFAYVRDVTSDVFGVVA